jgi:TRAP-type C4-dicarboxylate transport system permease small subunit
MSSIAEAQRAAHAGESEPAPPEPRPVAVLRRIDRALARLEEVLLSAALLSLILIGVYSALKRNFFPPSLFWADEVIRYAVFLIGLLGAALAAQSDRLFNIDMFQRLMGVRGKLVTRIVCAGFTIAVCMVFLSSSRLLRTVLEGEEYEIVPPTVGVLPLPGTMIAISIHLLLHIAIDAYYLSSGKPPPELAAPKVGH